MARSVPFLLSRAALLGTVVLVAVVLGAVAAGAVPARACWAPPVQAPVVDPFREPACPWCPGNRGIEYGTGPGVVVRSVATGSVTFSGRVAGVRYLVVGLGDGRRLTYGGLATSPFVEGDLVVAGVRVGVTDRNLHVGLRHGDTYVDPAPHLGRLVYRARLVPLDDAERRDPGPPRIRCADTVRGDGRPDTLSGRLVRPG